MHRFEKDIWIMTTLGRVEGTFQIIDPDRVVVLVKGGAGLYPLGTVFVHNGELRRQSSNGAEWTAFPRGLYDEWCAEMHIRQQAGVTPAKNGELQMLFNGTRDARDYVRTILDSAVLSDDEASECRQSFSTVVSGLGRARDVQKRIAHVDLARALQPIDSLGRRNPAAAALAAGQGIGRLQRREENVRRILRYVGQRSIRVHAAIMETVRSYEALLDCLGGRRPARPPSNAVLWSFVHRPSPSGRDEAVDVLLRHRLIFNLICAEPFRKNALWMREDIKQALRMLNSPLIVTSIGGMGLLQERFLKMRQGIAWALALHALEMEIRTPLGLLLGEIRLGVRAQRKAVGAPDRTHVAIGRADAPERFAVLIGRIEDFRSRVERCSDTLLATKVKEPLLAHIDEALVFVEQDDWLEVKNQLAEAAALL
jgi:hypothetical protein